MLINAFLYCWTNTENNMMYIGSHVGTIDDGYICSSKCMLADYKKNSSVFVRQIVAYGCESDIRKLETTLLKTIDACNDQQFYNLNNHAYPQQSGWKHSSLSKSKISKAGTGRVHTKYTKAYLSAMFKNNPPNPGKRSEQTKAKMSIRKLGNISNTGKIWINNGTKSIMISKDKAIPSGFSRGRCKTYGDTN